MNTTTPLDIKVLDDLDHHLDRTNLTLQINGELVTLSKRGRFDYLLIHQSGGERTETPYLTLDAMLVQMVGMMALKPYLGQRAYTPNGPGTLVDLVEDHQDTVPVPYARVELDGGVAHWYPLTSIELMITHHAG